MKTFEALFRTHARRPSRLRHDCFGTHFHSLVHGPKRFCGTKSEVQLSMYSKRLESSQPEFGRAYIKTFGRIVIFSILDI